VVGTVIGMGFEYDDARDLRWRERLRERLTTLIADPRFEVVTAHAIETLVQPAYPIDPSDIAVRWFERGGEAQGELHWKAIEPIGGDRVSLGWFVDRSPEHAAARQLSHFEDHPDGGEGIMVLAKPSGQLFLHDSGRGVLLPFALEFEDYVELQIAALGLGGVLDALVELQDHGWPETCDSAKEARLRREAQRGGARATLATAQRLFGDRDFGVLERRIAALNRQ
jgi:hypothetical protein